MKEQIKLQGELNFCFLYPIIFIMNKSVPDYIMQVNINFRGVFNELKKSFILK